MPQHEDHDDLNALDFSAQGSGTDDVEESDALDFSVADDSDEDADADALNEFAPPEPEEEDSATELGTIHSAAEATEEEDEEETVELFTVTNPSDTVSVSAAMDGRTQQIELSAKVTKMSESQLADEILALADLARQKGLAGQHTYLLENAFVSDLMQEMGPENSADDTALRDFVENFMELPSPEKADEAQAKVFADRYATDK